MTILVDLENEYQATFGTNPKIGKVNYGGSDGGGTVAITVPNGVINESAFQIANRVQKGNVTSTGSILGTTDAYGTEIWLPSYLEDIQGPNNQRLQLDLLYCTMRVTGSANYVKTPLAERRGSVKELYNIDDYKFVIKGFLIDKKNRVFPEADLAMLKVIHESGQPFRLRNALSDQFLTEDDRVVIMGFELPEVDGGRKHVRPFVMTLESDSVFKLEVE